MNKKTKFITYVSVFTALAVIANIFVIPLGGGSNFISLVYIPCFFAGIYLGPLSGLAVGAIADVLGCIIAPKGAWLPLITVASGLLGLIPGLVFKYFKIKNDTVKLLLSIYFCLLICTCGLNTLATYLAYSKGKTFAAYLAVRVPTQLLVASVNFIIIGALMRVKPLTKMLTPENN